MTDIGRDIELLDRNHAAILRRKTGLASLKSAYSLMGFARQMLAAGVHQSYPQWTEQQIRREVARRFSHGATDTIPLDRDDAGAARR